MGLRRIGAVFISIVLMLSSLSITSIFALAEDSNSSDYTTSNEGHLGAYIGAETAVTLPQEVNGIKMFYIDRTFYNCTTVGSVVVPEGYTGMSDNAFMGATSLKSVSLPETIETLGSSCFRNCTSLVTINIPKKITSIPRYAFRGSTNPDLVIDIQSTSITSIESHAFRDVVGTIKVYSQEMYDLISANASSANVVLAEATEPSSELTTTDPSYFTYDGSTITGYTGTETDIVLPTEINGTKMIEMNRTFYQNTSVVSVVVPEGYTSMSDSAFMGAASLKSVLLPETMETLGSSCFRICTSLETINIPKKITSIPRYTFRGCTNPDLVIDIQSTSITSIESYAFRDVVGTIKVYSQEMYDLISANASSANVVLVTGPTPSIDYTALDAAIASGEAVDTSKYAEALVTALTDAIAAGKAVKENTSATQTDVDNAAKAINDAISNLKIDYTAMDAAIATAEDIIANHSDEYTSESIADLKFGLDTAKAYRNRDVGQATIDQVTRVYLTLKIENLVKIDIQAMLAELQTVIGKAEAIDASEYTEESYQVLADAIELAKAMNEGSNYQDILDAQNKINNAISKLILRPLEEFVNVYKNGATATLASGKADATIAGASSIRVTFNCASDVSYNEYSSIELKAVVSGTESYEKFIGKGDYTTGTNGWTETLKLTNAIAEGQSYEITAFTYAWANASDYVFAVSKVEFIDAEGKVISKVTAETVAMDELEKAIAEAEGMDTSLYTDESAAVLTTAIGVAKTITDKSSKAEITAATEAIRTAIAELELKPAKTGSISGRIIVSDEDDSTEMRVAAVTADGTEVSVTADSMGRYIIEDIEIGECTLRISGGKYTPRTYEVTVEASGITQDVSLNPYGDINGDGKVTTLDVGMVNSHVKEVTKLEGYQLDCADVSKDESITTLDVGMINSHAKSVKALW